MLDDLRQICSIVVFFEEINEFRGSRNVVEINWKKMLLIQKIFEKISQTTKTQKQMKTQTTKT